MSKRCVRPIETSPKMPAQHKVAIFHESLASRRRAFTFADRPRAPTTLAITPPLRFHAPAQCPTKRRARRSNLGCQFAQCGLAFAPIPCGSTASAAFPYQCLAIPPGHFPPKSKLTAETIAPPQSSLQFASDLATASSVAAANCPTPSYQLITKCRLTNRGFFSRKRARTACFCAGNAP